MAGSGWVYCLQLRIRQGVESPWNFPWTRRPRHSRSYVPCPHLTEHLQVVLVLVQIQHVGLQQAAGPAATRDRGAAPRALTDRQLRRTRRQALAVHPGSASPAGRRSQPGSPPARPLAPAAPCTSPAGPAPAPRPCADAELRETAAQSQGGRPRPLPGPRSLPGLRFQMRNPHQRGLCRPRGPEVAFSLCYS